MSAFNSDRCTKEELSNFKIEVAQWLDAEFPKWREKFKIKAFTCYNGDVRLYDGSYNEFPNRKSSFRREEANKDEDGRIIGYTGTRGIHSTRFSEYISINRDEFEELKKTWKEKEKDDMWDFQYDLIFRKLV